MAPEPLPQRPDRLAIRSEAIASSGDTGDRNPGVYDVADDALLRLGVGAGHGDAPPGGSHEVVGDRHASRAVVMRLHDDRTHAPSLQSAFGTLVQEAADLMITPRIAVSIEPPPNGSVASAPRPPDVVLVLKDGVLVQ
jgi:hypothetical protein